MNHLYHAIANALQLKMHKGKNAFVWLLLLFAATVISSLQAGAQVARRGSTTVASKAGGTSTTFTINKPSAVVQGDVMIFIYSALRATAYPSLNGWQVARQGTYTADLVNNRQGGVAVVMYKIAGAIEPASYSFTVEAPVTSIGAIMAFSGVDITGTTPFDSPIQILEREYVHSAYAYPITTENPESAVLMVVMNQDWRTYSSWLTASPGALSEIADNHVLNSSNNDQTSVAAGWAIKPTAGSTGQGSVYMDGISQVYGLLLALKRNPPPPVISSFAPASGPVGGSVVISGTGFNPDPAQNTVYFGAAKATVTAASATSLTVTVPAGSTFQNISVCNTRYKSTGYSAKPFIVTLDEGSLNFSPKTEFTQVNDQPVSIIAADVDGDGLTDLVYPSFVSNNICILANQSSSGNLAFNTKLTLATGTSPYAVAFEDVDGDGKKDLVSTNYGANTVSVFKNTSAPGAVSFSARQDFATGIQPIGVAITDIDGDGKADIVAANYGANTVSVLRNTTAFGVMSFAAKTDYAAGTQPYSVRLADIDGNGKADIITANYGSANISVLRNVSVAGTLSFASRVNIATGSFPRSLAVGDVDGDGKTDIAVANYNANTLSVFRNLSAVGSITLAARADYVASGSPTAVTIGDIDGDGKPDLAMTNQTAKTVSVFKNNSTPGSLNITASAELATGTDPREVVICDINNDGKPDMSIASNGSPSVTIIKQVCNTPQISAISPQQPAPGSTITITGTNFSGTGTVSFAGTPLQVNSWTKTSIQAVLPNNKYGGNLVVTNECFSQASYVISIPPTINSFSPQSGPVGTTVTISGNNFNPVQQQNVVYFGAVKANITAASATSLSVTVPQAAAYQPITVINLSANLGATTTKPFNVTLNGAIAFKPAVNFATGSGPAPVASGDFDGDGLPDIVIGNAAASTVSVLRNISQNTTANFSARSDYSVGTNPSDVYVQDFDGDGRPDIATTNLLSNNISLLKNISSGAGDISFAAKIDLPGYQTGSAGALIISDLDGDGKADIVFSNPSTNLLSFYLNTSVNGNTSFATRFDMAGSSGSMSMKLADIDGDGKADIVTAANNQSFQVYLNKSTPGSLNFNTKSSFTTGSGSFAIAAGDIDGDGKPDVAVVNETSKTLSVHINTSAGGSVSFAPKVDYDLDVNPRALAIGDIDGDGKPDISVTSFGSNTVSLFHNNSTAGNASFAKTNLTAGTNPRGIAFGDLNGDGKPDLAIANSGTNTVSIYQQDCINATLPEFSTASVNNCGTQSAVLTISGGSLHNAIAWKWYTVSCGGTPAGTGNSITVSPAATTTYYARGEGGCTTAGECASITVNVSTPVTWYRDADGDSYGNAAITMSACEQPNGYVLQAGDCDDTNAAVNPGAQEICNGIDDDCDGLIDDADPSTLSASKTMYYIDADHDGFGGTRTALLCNQQPGYTLTGGDCNDSDSTINPNTVWYKDADDDGYSDGTTLTQCTKPAGYKLSSQLTATSGDCNDADAAINPNTIWYKDADNDGYSDGSTLIQCDQPAGYRLSTALIATAGDCNDVNPAVNPGAQEICNGIDDDCDGLIDDADPSTLPASKTMYYIDADHDGFGGTRTALLCNQQPGYTLTGGDCNDSDSTINPNTVWYKDADDDGYSDGTTLTQCTKPAGYKLSSKLTATSGDCNDADAAINPNTVWYKDADNDGYSDGNTLTQCDQPAGYRLSTALIATAGDCNDVNPAVNPGAQEICNGIDDDCDGLIDDADPSTLPSSKTMYYIDADHDGYGGTFTILLCNQQPGFTLTGGDCDDNNALVWRSAMVYIDNDGDGYTAGAPVSICYGPVLPAGYALTSLGEDCNDNDASLSTSQTYYVDADKDGYGSTVSVQLCSATAPEGYSTNNTDCNDNDAGIHAPVSYYIDADKDGYGSTTSVLLCSAAAPEGYSTDNTDCNDNDAAIHGPVSYYIDADNDGYGSKLTALVCASAPPLGYSTNNTDCNDNDALVHSPITYYQDQDKDGYGTSKTTTSCSSVPPAGYSARTGDCNDKDATIYPGAPEICDGKDNNCNGLIDDNCQPPLGVSINDVSMAEGNNGKKTMVFTVSLSNPYTSSVTITYSTSDGTAIAGSDYTAASGSIVIKAGSLTQSISINILPDKVYEPNETFSVTISAANANVEVTKATGTGTILNDDAGIAAGIPITLAGGREIPSVTMAPNPAKNTVLLQLKGYSGMISLQLMTAEGKVLKQEKTEATADRPSQVSFNVSTLANGMYWVLISSEKGKATMQKLMIVH